MSSCPIWAAIQSGEAPSLQVTNLYFFKFNISKFMEIIFGEYVKFQDNVEDRFILLLVLVRTLLD